MKAGEYRLSEGNNGKAAFLQLVGGEALLRREYPDIFDLIWYSKKPETKGINHKGFSNTLYIDYLSYDRASQRITVKAVVSLLHQATVMATDITVKTEGGIILGQICMRSHEKNRDVFLFHIDQIDPGLLKKHILIAEVHTCWHEAEHDVIREMELKDACIVNLTTVVESQEVVHPRHVKSQEQGPITVSYNRSTSGEMIDYSYECRMLPEGQELYLESAGKVKLLGNKKFSEAFRFTALVDSARGVAMYQNTDEIKIEKTGDGFTWSLNRDWNNYVPTNRLPLKDPVIFRFRLNFYCQGDTEPYSITVSSDLDVPSADAVKISQLRLLWGCLAVNSKILKEDGSECLIQDIRPGDSLRDGSYGSRAQVMDVICGSEEYIYCIQTEGGKEIQATDSHPFMTERGIVSVKNLTGADRLRMEDGRFERITALYQQEFHDRVYNLILGDSSHTFCCNGFVTGDFQMQNEISGYPDKEIIPMGVRWDLEKWGENRVISKSANVTCEQ